MVRASNVYATKADLKLKGRVVKKRGKWELAVVSLKMSKKGQNQI